MITTWFQSQLLLNIQETNPNATIYDYFMDNDHCKSYIVDFLKLHITKSNFKHIIELGDFLMVDDIDYVNPINPKNNKDTFT